jgi:hypothetical protein
MISKLEYGKYIVLGINSELVPTSSISGSDRVVGWWNGSGICSINTINFFQSSPRMSRYLPFSQEQANKIIIANEWDRVHIVNVCDCGSLKTGFSTHSYWCSMSGKEA